MVVFTKQQLRTLTKLQRQGIVSEEQKQQQEYEQQVSQYESQKAEYDKQVSEYNKQKAAYEQQQKAIETEKNEWTIAETFARNKPEFIGFLPESIKAKARELQSQGIEDWDTIRQKQLDALQSKYDYSSLASGGYSIKDKPDYYGVMEYKFTPQRYPTQESNIMQQSIKMPTAKIVDVSPPPSTISLPTQNEQIRGQIYKYTGIDIPGQKVAYERLFGERFKYGLGYAEKIPVVSQLSFLGYGLQTTSEGVGKLSGDLWGRTGVVQRVEENKVYPQKVTTGGEFKQNIKYELFTPKDIENVVGLGTYYASYSLIPPIAAESIFTSKGISSAANTNFPTNERIVGVGESIVGGTLLFKSLTKPSIRIIKKPTTTFKSATTITPTKNSKVFKAEYVLKAKTTPSIAEYTTPIRTIFNKQKYFQLTPPRTIISKTFEPVYFRTIKKGAIQLEPAEILSKRVGANLGFVYTQEKSAALRLAKQGIKQIDIGTGTFYKSARFSPKSKKTILQLYPFAKREYTGSLSAVKKIRTINFGTTKATLYNTKTLQGLAGGRTTYSIDGRTLIFNRLPEDSTKVFISTTSKGKPVLKEMANQITSSLEVQSAPIIKDIIKSSQQSVYSQKYQLIKSLKTESKVIPIPKVEIKQIQQSKIKQNIIPSSTTKTIIKSSEIIKTTPKIIPALNTKTIQLPALQTRTLQKPALQTRTLQKPALQTKSLQRMLSQTRTTQRSMVNSKTNLRIIPKPTKSIFLPSSLTSITPKTSVKEAGYSPAFKVFIKRRGKYLEIGKELPKGRALKLGAEAAETTLGATFRIEETGTTKLPDTFYKPSYKFRDYRIVKGKRVSLKNEYIQRRGTRLSTRPEIKEIQSSKIGRGFRFI